MTGIAYVIGDETLGLTIVVTDPVLVVHYPPADLGRTPDLRRERMAQILEELVPLFRGVNLDQLEQRLGEIFGPPHPKGSSRFTMDQEEKAIRERDYANTIARMVNRGTKVMDVSFCLATEVVPDRFENGGRRFDPAGSIYDYVAANKDNPTRILPTPIALDAGIPSDVGELPPWRRT